MGQFSFLCKKCNKPILSSVTVGQPCKLFLLENGKVVEEMTGQYDGYGRVLDGWLKSKFWVMLEWDKVCDLMFKHDEGNGIAAYHLNCFDGTIPKTRSESAENQGMDDYFEAVVEGRIYLDAI